MSIVYDSDWIPMNDPSEYVKAVAAYVAAQLYMQVDNAAVSYAQVHEYVRKNSTVRVEANTASRNHRLYFEIAAPEIAKATFAHSLEEAVDERDDLV